MVPDTAPEQPPQPQPPQPSKFTAAQIDERIANAPLPDIAKNWLRARHGYIDTPEKEALLQYLHPVVVAQTGQAFTPRYERRLRTLLGIDDEPTLTPASKGHAAEAAPPEPPAAPERSVVTPPF